jgi:hypothetical protein
MEASEEESLPEKYGVRDADRIMELKQTDPRGYRESQSHCKITEAYK